MAKIALDVERALARRALNGSPGCTTAQLLARGDGWVVEDVVCTSGPHDRSFEEQHSTVSIAIVVAGSFQYRADSRTGPDSELMTPGSLLLGNPGQYFECGHAHGAGDRCLSFRYAPDYFARLAADAGARDSTSRFRVLRLPPVRALSPVIALSCAGLAGSTARSWEELSVQVAVHTLQTAGGLARNTRDASAKAVARVTRIVRTIERHPDGGLTLEALARFGGPESVSFPPPVRARDRCDAAPVCPPGAAPRRGDAPGRRAVEGPRHCPGLRLRRRLELQSRVSRRVRRRATGVPCAPPPRSSG